MKELPEELLNARVVFWCCPNPQHRFVTWRIEEALMIPRCDECGIEGVPR